MAATVVEFLAGSGHTLTLKLFALGSDSIANGAGGDAMTEETNREGLYLATVDEALAGIYHAHVFDASGILVRPGYVRLADDTNTYRVEQSYATVLALPNAQYDAAGGLPISDAGGLDMDQLADIYDAVTNTGVALPSSADSYWSKTFYTRDTGSGQDEYRTVWFKNDEPLTSGVSLTKLWVVDDSSNDKIGTSGSPTSMSEVGSDHFFLYNATAAGEKIAAGVGFAVMTYATIDSVERKWREVFNRDT